MSFNLDQLTGWYMKQQLAKNIKTTIFIAPDRILVTVGFVILLNLKVKVLLNCANCISQKRFHMISASIFLTFVHLELLYQIYGLSLYVEKLI